jgi:16S rRNA (guanine966-N2)-methyltransferase
VRVIAGTLGGRRLVAPRGLETRPSSDRVREALFMALGALEGARVVDLFAGSGAMGIEALSRGAVHADFAEIARPALAALEENLTRLDLGERSRVWRIRVPEGLARMARSLAAADLVVLDPPYGGGPARATIRALGGEGILSVNCRVVLEHHAKDEIPDATGSLECAGRRRYGETAVTLYRVRAAGTPIREETAR